MKILMLNNEYLPLGGGQANANYYLYKEFEKYKDLEIDIITASIDKEKTEKTKIGKIYFLDIGKKGKNLHFQTSKELINYSLKSLSLAKKLIKQEKYDLIVAWSGVPAGYLSYRLNKKFQIPYIVLLRGADVPFWEERWKTLDKHIFSWLSPKVWRNATFVIANSQGLKEQALKISENQKISVIPNGVDISLFKPIKTKKENKKTIILGVGRLIPRKGLDYLIKSLGQLQNLNFELWLVGDGPEKENLQNLANESNISDKVRFLGIKDKKEIVGIYQQVDIFVLPSLNEGMSNTILEAMACGLPIIATNIAGNDELIKENGFTIPVKDEEALKEKLELLINDKSLRENMGKQSRKLTETMGWNVIADKFYGAFEVK